MAKAIDSLAVKNSNESLGEILVRVKVITPQKLEHALEQAQSRNKSVTEVLIEDNIVAQETLPVVLSLYLNLPLIDLKRHRIQPEALRLVPEKMARKHNLIPLDKVGDSLVVVMEDPQNIQVIEDLKAVTRLDIQPAVGNPPDIWEAIDLHYRALEDVKGKLDAIEPPASPLKQAEGQPLVDLTSEAPVLHAMDILITQAVRDRASDIHIEPQKDRVRVRYRIDGILHEVMSLPLRVHPMLISRVKIMGEMNVAERRRPQDGQFSTRVGEKEIDVRVATYNTIYGELAVLRVLDKSTAFLALPELGLLPDPLRTLQQMLRFPFGMILVSGPTGSGKTTTLYAAINHLDRNERNIVTIEDPVEYHFSDINSSEVNPRADITFASGLRAILRTDPDIILVGEIRDEETARTAVQAALTGHLVLSSIHANDATGALFRLVDLGIEPILLSSALIGAVAQRMVRRICPHCRSPVQPKVEELAAYQEEMKEMVTHFYYGAGCNFCANTGYLGRTGVFEILSMSEEIKRLFLSGARPSDITAQAIREGMVPMSRDGMLKVKGGITTPYEVLRNLLPYAGER